MRFWMIISLTLAFTFSFSGCLTNSGSDGSTWQAPAYDNSASIIVEIDAAEELTFDDARTRAYADIASRPHLSARVQVYLVKKSMKSLTFDDAKRDVLLALVNNPYFLHEGKMAILDNLDSLTFDSGKQQVLKAIDARGIVPNERQFNLERRQRQETEDKKPLSTEINGVQVETYGEIRISAESGNL